MTSMIMKMASPVPVYLDNASAEGLLARRPSSLDGKVLGLLPNWRPAAVNILKALGTLVEARYNLKSIIMEPPVRERPSDGGQGGLAGSMRRQLDDLAKRVDVVVLGTGD